MTSFSFLALYTLEILVVSIELYILIIMLETRQ